MSFNGPQGAPAADRFVISIVLNGDVEHFDKSRAVDVNDVPQGVLTTIATEKPPE
jgi:hypothetical protein